MQCRSGCAACCIAPSISSPMPGLPEGKPAGVACPHLDAAWRCRLFGKPERPAVCAGFQAEMAICGDSREEAMQIISLLEQVSLPA
ncbi:MAG: YkgJ family cysteine cluster protein [Gammaproteobacteria bacterium]|nr:YkgJ family cysteine cluster protein [Gammaproteobacteria bacterium]